MLLSNKWANVHRYAEESKKSCVNEVFAGGKDALEAGGRGAVIGKCSFRMEEVCRFKYLINVSPGGSYTGRLKYLFLCGSVVGGCVRGECSLTHSTLEPCI